MNKKIFFVIPFVLLSLVIGILAGLFRMGWMIPVGDVAAEHGALMVGSFLGSVITLERIIVLKKKWLYAFPAISGISLIPLLLHNQQVALIMQAVGSLGLIYIYLVLISRFKEYYYYVMIVGAVGWSVGILIVLFGGSYAEAVLWWIAFILLTVFGERLELSKFLPTSSKKRITMILSIAVYMVGIAIPADWGSKIISGLGLMLMAVWLLHYDIARKSVKSHGIHRFMGAMLLLGYVWMAFCGLLLILDPVSIYHYDAMLHTFFLGFTFSMIFAHAPIIFPGVAGLSIRPYHGSLFFWGIVLQLALIIRISGDLLEISYWRKIGGMANGVIIILFFINLVILFVREQRRTT